MSSTLERAARRRDRKARERLEIAEQVAGIGSHGNASHSPTFLRESGYTPLDLVQANAAGFLTPLTIAALEAQLSGGGGGHTLLDETSALTQRTKLAFLGSGVKVLDDLGNDETEVVVGAYYDAIVDTNDTNAKGKGNVYATLQAAIDAGHKSIFIRAAGDTFGSSRLNASMTAGQTTVPIVELSSFPDAGFVLVEREIIQYTGRSGSSGSGTLTGATRGAKGTTAIAHNIDSGTATSGANHAAPLKTGSLTNTAETWTTDEHVDKTLALTGGTGSGQSRRIVANSATVLQIENPWTTPPNATSTYEIQAPVGNAVAIASGDSVARLVGHAANDSAIPCHISTTKTDLVVESLRVTAGARMLFQGVRGTFFAGLIDGTGRVEAAAADCTVIGTRVVGATVTPVLSWAFDGFRAISCQWLLCSGASLLCIDTPSGVYLKAGAITGCTSSGNTCTAYQITTTRGQTGGITGSTFGLQSWNISGNVFGRFDNGGFLMRGMAITIAGNLFDGRTLVSGQRAIYQEGATGNGTAGRWSITGNTFINLDYAFDSQGGASTWVVLLGNNVFGEATQVKPGPYTGLMGNVYDNMTLTLTSTASQAAVIGGVCIGAASITNRTISHLVKDIYPIGLSGSGWEDGGPPQAGEQPRTATAVTCANGANANLAIPTYSQYVRIVGPTAAFNISGLTGGRGGQRLFLQNTTTQNMTLNHEDAGSTAGTRFRMSDAANKATTGEGWAELLYDDVLDRWLYMTGAL